MVLYVCVCVSRMGSALLSRFDIVFLLLDVPEESHDRLLSEHVMATRAGRGGVSSATVSRANNSQLESSLLLEASEAPLSERLQVRETSHDIIWWRRETQGAYGPEYTLSYELIKPGSSLFAFTMWGSL